MKRSTRFVLFVLLTGLVMLAVNKTIVEVQRTNELSYYDSLVELSERETTDWTDFRRLRAEKLRSGPGEFGVPVVLDDFDTALSKSLAENYSYNVLVSDRISLDRAVPDTRAEA